MDQGKPEAKSFKQLTISVEKLPASTVQQEALRSYAADRARLLLGCYRTGDANDPETYVAAITAVLSHYPEHVITEVTHPVRGLPSRNSWLPTVKEVNAACENIIAPIREQEERDNRVRRQLAEREASENAPRPTLEQLKEKYGASWGIGTEKQKIASADSAPAPTIQQLREHYSKYSLAFEPKNAQPMRGEAHSSENMVNS